MKPFLSIRKLAWLLVLCPFLGHSQTNVTPANLNGMRYATQFNWKQYPSDDLSSAGSKTVHLAPCPQGIDASGFAAAQYSVYIAVTGTAEAVPVTGGTCTPGASSGTVTVTTQNAHTAGYTVGSASSGIQEGFNSACGGTAIVSSTGGYCKLALSPSTTTATNFTVNATVYFNLRNSKKASLEGQNGNVLCNTRGPCLYQGNRNGASNQIVVDGVNFVPGLNIDGVQILDVTAVSGTYTVHTAGPHPFSMTANAGLPDYVSLSYWVTTGVNGQGVMSGIFPVASVPDNTHFTFTTGSSSFSNSTGWGYAALENAAIEDNAEDSAISHISFTVNGSNHLHYQVVNDNDQHFDVSNLHAGSAGVRCDANFCGYSVYQRGDQGNAGVLYLHDSDLSMNCNGNAVWANSGNVVSISNTIVQAYNQYGVNIGGGLQSAKLDKVYEEIGNCTNPVYPGPLAYQVGLLTSANRTTISGSDPLVGGMQYFATGGSAGAQINYFVVPRSSVNGASTVMPVGPAQPSNGAVTVNVYWPCVSPLDVANHTAGTVTYDLLATVGTSPIPLVGTQTVAVTTGISGSPNSAGICTFADTQAARSSYTFAPGNAFQPSVWFWPSNIAVNGGVVYEDNYLISGTYPAGEDVSSAGGAYPAIFTKTCASGGGPLAVPFWVQCLNGIAGGISGGQGGIATVLQQIDVANNGPPANSKGRINLGKVLPAFPNDLITLQDSNFSKTTATPGMRPSNDAGDTAFGADQSSGFSVRAGTSISQYIGTLNDNASYLERLTSSLKTVAVPLALKEGAAPTFNTGFDEIWANLGTHRIQFNPNGTTSATTLSFVGIGTPATGGDCPKFAANGYDLVDNGLCNTSAWSSITNPTGNLSLGMGSFTTLFTWGAATGTNDLFKLVDTTGDTGIGNLLRVSTAGGSTEHPFQFDANGNGIQMSAGGVVNSVGIGGIAGAAVNNGVVGSAFGGTGASSLAYGLVLANGSSAMTSLVPINGDCAIGAGSTWVASVCPGAVGSTVVTNPGTTGTNVIVPTADAVALSVVGKTTQANDVFAVYGQALMTVPSAPVLTQVSGGSIGSSAYYAEATCVDNFGNQTTVGAESAQFTTSANNFLIVTGVTTANAPLGCEGWLPYITLAGGSSGSETLQLATGSQCSQASNTVIGACAVGATWTQTVATTTGSAVPGSNTAKVKNLWIGANGSFNISGSLPSSPITIFLPGNLSSVWTGGTWTPYNNITVTRIQVQTKTAPLTCSTNAVVQITDGVNAQTLTITGAANDSGVISQNYSASTPLTIGISTAASSCGTVPADANVVIEVKLH